VGHIFREASSGYKYFDNVTALKEHLAANPLKNVTILIKGSLSNRLSTIVDAL
jgi:UDP-N-acetylmuramyl pentapeptide synthase